MSHRFALTWEFVETHYPDYHHCNIICAVGDMSACFEFADLDGQAPITENTVAALKAQAGEYEPSYQQVCCFDDYINSGKTFDEALQETDDYCYAVAIQSCRDVLPACYRTWADNVLANH